MYKVINCRQIGKKKCMRCVHIASYVAAHAIGHALCERKIG